MKVNERLEIYRGLLGVYEAESVNGSFSNFGICYHLKRVSGKNVYSEIIFKRLFPELYKQKPEFVFMFWWDVSLTQPRINAIEEAIRLCEVKLNK